MIPSYLRAVAGACVLTTGLLATGGVGIAVASPDNDDSGTSAHQSPASSGKSPGRAKNRPSAPNSANTVTGPSAAQVAAGGEASTGITPGAGAQTPGVKPIKVPFGISAASPSKPVAIPNLPDITKTAGAAINSIAEATRDLSISVPSAAAVPPAPLAVPTSTAPVAGPLSDIIQPLGALVGDVATAIIGGKALQPFVDVADQLLAGVSNAPSGNTIPNTLRNDRSTLTVPTSTSLVQPPLGSSSIAAVPGASVGPSLSLGAQESAGVLTPQLLSSQVDVSAALPPAVAPSVPPVADAWLGNIASQIFHGVREALRNVSVTELAWAALPGLAGLMFFFATGVGLGRRQAKFGFVMATSGAVRFAVRGPLGVVRNGSSIKLHRKKAAPQHAATAVATGTDGTAPSGRRHLRLVEPAA